jgi:hypothetical protein
MDESNLDHFHALLDNRRYDEGTCFLCGGSLEKLIPSSEHVIPRWAQNRYDLWNQRLTLLNGSSIPYRYLTIPCCEECNKYRLQPIETIVSEAVLNGPEAVRDLGSRILFLWVGKIFYGILYKELFLSSVLADGNSLPILTPDVIQEYKDHLFFLQEARGKIETVDFCPGSILVFRTQTINYPRFQWDITDNIDTLFIGIRMGEVGIVAVLNDGGILLLLEDFFADVRDFPLHPLQFRELCAAVSYRSSIRQRTPKYMTFEGNPHQVHQMPLGGFSMKPFYEDWDFDVYAHYLSFYTRTPVEYIRPHPNQIRSFIYDMEGKPMFVPFDENDEFFKMISNA